MSHNNKAEEAETTANQAPKAKVLNQPSFEDRPRFLLVFRHGDRPIMALVSGGEVSGQSRFRVANVFANTAG